MLPGSLRTVVERALAEDVRSGDLTSRLTLDENWEARALVRVRTNGVFAGGQVIAATFDVLADGAVEVDVQRPEGAVVRPNHVLAEIAGPARVVLAGERVVLNFLQRLSGIATLTAKYVKAVAGTDVHITDTRKTTPGLRMLEKHAVRCGGGQNHRFGLDDCVMIKDNHLALYEMHMGVDRPAALQATIAAARAHAGHAVRIVAEAETEAEARAAAEAGADVVMLDNFPLEELRRCVRVLRKRAPGVMLEASGGVTLRTVAAIANTGVDVISVGALTHSPPALDIGMDIL